MSRLSDHHFVMPEAPVWGFRDPFYDPDPDDEPETDSEQEEPDVRH
jgi:hypothetical protein